MFAVKKVAPGVVIVVDTSRCIIAGVYEEIKSDFATNIVKHTFDGEDNPYKEVEQYEEFKKGNPIWWLHDDEVAQRTAPSVDESMDLVLLEIHENRVLWKKFKKFNSTADMQAMDDALYSLHTKYTQLLLENPDPKPLPKWFTKKYGFFLWNGRPRDGVYTDVVKKNIIGDVHGSDYFQTDTDWMSKYKPLREHNPDKFERWSSLVFEVHKKEEDRTAYVIDDPTFYERQARIAYDLKQLKFSTTEACASFILQTPVIAWLGHDFAAEVEEKDDSFFAKHIFKTSDGTEPPDVTRFVRHGITYTEVEEYNGLKRGMKITISRKKHMSGKAKLTDGYSLADKLKVTRLLASLEEKERERNKWNFNWNFHVHSEINW